MVNLGPKMLKLGPRRVSSKMVKLGPKITELGLNMTALCLSPKKLFQGQNRESGVQKDRDRAPNDKVGAQTGLEGAKKRPSWGP